MNCAKHEQRHKIKLGTAQAGSGRTVRLQQIKSPLARSGLVKWCAVCLDHDID